MKYLLNKIVNKLRTSYKWYALDNIAYGRYLGTKIGKDCRIYTKDFGSEPWLIEIGNHVTITSGVRFINHDGSTWLIGDEKGRRQIFKRIIIGNNVFVGVNSIILPGVKIDDNVVIAAGSVLTKSVPAGSMVGGNPAKIIGSFDTYKKRVLETYVSNDDMDFNLSYEDMVNEILDTSFKKPLE
jgi:acetyltransferase-like isoleucine patch superfamily enzyme